MSAINAWIYDMRAVIITPKAISRNGSNNNSPITVRNSSRVILPRELPVPHNGRGREIAVNGAGIARTPG